MRTLIRLIRAVLAAAVLLALLVGIPAALWAFGVGPPTSLPTWDEFQVLLTTPDTGGVFLALLTVVGWVAWAGFTVAVVAELRGLRLGRPARRIRGLGPAQQLAAALLGAIILTNVAPSPVATGSDDLPAPTRGAEVAAVQVVYGDEDIDDAQDHETAHHQVRQEAPTYTVKPGDSLWKVAEEFLGDGNRWVEIADLNYDRVQPDGRQLDRDDRWLHPGWVLELPPEVAEEYASEQAVVAEPSTQVAQQSGSGMAFTHVVQPGETLQDIAQMHLGDRGRFMEIFEANQGVLQADGAVLQDPDMIRPGWHIQFTAAHTNRVQTIDQGQPAPAAQAIPAGMDERAPVPDWSPAIGEPDLTLEPADGSEQTPPSADLEDRDQAPWTLWGGGGVLAAGLVSAVSLRRSMASRRREPGQRLSMPSGSSALLEAELRFVADAEGVAMIDASLRELGQWCTDNDQVLPSVAAARTRQGAVRLYLDGPAQLPRPWVASHANTVWSRPPRDEAPQPPAPSEVVAGAPFPCLVTVGRDPRGDSVHIDIEHVGMVSIDGTMKLARSALRALVVELATNPWTEGARIDLIGCFGELAHAIDTGRLRHAETLEPLRRSLTRSAATTRDLLTSAGVGSVNEARGRGVAKDAWDPQIVVVGTPLSTEESDWLAQLCQDPTSGVVAVGLGLEQATWTVRVDATDQAHLSPAGLSLRPQLLDEAHYRAALDVLSRAGQVVNGPQWAENLTQDEPLLSALPMPAKAASAQARQSAEVIELRPPTIRVLGPVVLDAESTGPLRPSHEAQALEILTYLALHRGVDGPTLSEAIWPGSQPNTSTRNSAVSRARAWLGEDPAGDPYLRRVADDGLYELHGVSTDWDHFSALVRPGLAKAPLPQLMSALGLVRGVPFDRSRPGRYRLRAARYAWAEFLAQEMTASIADVAFAASTRALQQAATPEALTAARTGLKVAPWEERLWRCAIRAMWAMSDADGIGQVVSELEAQLALLEAEPEDATRDLLDEIAMRLDGQVAPEARRAKW